MKVAMVTPFYHQPRGNTVTVKRLSDGLNSLGVETEIVSLTDDDTSPPITKADIVHGFNAYRFYTYLKHLDHSIDPYLVTLTGTDLNHDLYDKKRRDQVILSMSEAHAVHVFNETARDTVYDEVPSVKNKTFLVPQGIDDFSGEENRIEKDDGSFVFLLPAGIRKVKNVCAAISMLKGIKSFNSSVRLWIVGPIIEQDEGRKVQQLVKENSEWIRYFGQVPHHEMGSFYRSADVLINTSLSEGQSSAILEGMAQRIPVLVSDNTGNRSIVTNEKTGLIYHDDQSFLKHARRLLLDNMYRERLGNAASAYVEKHHSKEKEALDMLAIYEDILQGKL